MTGVCRLPSVQSTPDTTLASGATGSIPVLVGDWDLEARLPDLNSEGRYRAARLLTWLHGRPIGEVLLPLEGSPVTAGQLAALVWPLVADRVSAHCRDDGIPVPDHLPTG